jgi:hypothetical protein
MLSAPFSPSVLGATQSIYGLWIKTRPPVDSLCCQTRRSPDAEGGRPALLRHVANRCLGLSLCRVQSLHLDNPIRVFFGNLDRPLASLIAEQIPESPGAGTGKETQLALAHPRTGTHEETIIARLAAQHIN